MMKPIQVTRSSLPHLDDYIREIQDIWATRWLTNMGAKHDKLKALLLNHLAVPNLTLFTNGHLALEAALQTLDLEGEVITTPFTFVSTTHAIVRSGLTPVFCDINPDDYSLDAGKIEALITNKTCAILPVHVYGNVCDVEAINNVAKKYHLKVIYDAAHAFGVTVNGKGIGTFGDASMFSFHATKVFHTIEGGAVTYHDASLERRLRDMKNFGIRDPDSIVAVGGNAKMNEFQAAMGICNLRHIDDDIERRRLIVERYIEHLSGIPGIKLVAPQAGVRHNYAYFPVVFDGYKKNREQVFNELKQQNIMPRKYFYPLITDTECYRERHDSNQTPVAKHLADRVLTLPLYPDLDLDDVDRICSLIVSE